MITISMTTPKMVDVIARPIYQLSKVLTYDLTIRVSTFVANVVHHDATSPPKVASEQIVSVFVYIHIIVCHILGF